MHKHRNLFKPMMFVAPDGYIVECAGPFAAKYSDAVIMNKIMEKDSFKNFFKEGDCLVLDRGFRDSKVKLTEAGYTVAMPAFIAPGQKQLTADQANASRRVTKVRFIVEDTNGRIKQRFQRFMKPWFNRSLKNAFLDFQIACAIHNLYAPRILSDRGVQNEIGQLMRLRYRSTNPLQPIAERYTGRHWRNAAFVEMDARSDEDFPRFGSETLYTYTLGSYQIAKAKGYYGEHISDNGRFTIQVLADPESVDLEGTDITAERPVLLRARIQSRHQSSTKYQIYILYDAANKDADIKYYCTCKNGARTIGCCCHITTILWYLGWARYQTDIKCPQASMHIYEIEDWTDTDD